MSSPSGVSSLEYLRPMPQQFGQEPRLLQSPPCQFPIVIDKVGASFQLAPELVRRRLAGRCERKERKQQKVPLVVPRRVNGRRHDTQIRPYQPRAIGLPQELRSVELLQNRVEGRPHFGGEPDHGIGGVGHGPSHIGLQRHLADRPCVELIGQRVVIEIGELRAELEKRSHILARR